LSSEPACDRGGAQEIRLKPNVQVQWSNGIFLHNTSLGLHISQQPGVEFGPILSYARGCEASPEKKAAGIADIDAALEAGAFLNYYLRKDLRLRSKILMDVSGNQRGTSVNAEAQTFHKIAAHHGVGISLGMNWTNRGYTQSLSHFDPEWTMLFATSTGGKLQALAPQKQHPLKTVYAGLNWNWELSASWMITSQVVAAHVLNDTDDQFSSGKRHYGSFYTGLAYRF
ncbi:MAG: MipA/OmpV family protein, partial [Burkholderiales bacterium]|nr:MipA/OmpV family protein [Burkholderiales bacterium]